MKSTSINIILFCLSAVSCIGVQDSLETFCFVKNNSNRNITLRFSNTDTLDLNTLYGGWNSYVPSKTAYRVNKQGDKLFQEYYEGNNKKLYLYYLDQDTALAYYNKKDTINIVNKSFLQKQLVDIRNLKATDTLYFFENK